MCESEENIKRRLGICPEIDHSHFYEECCCLCEHQIEIYDISNNRFIGNGCHHKFYFNRKVYCFDDNNHSVCELFERRKLRGKLSRNNTSCDEKGN